MTLCTVLLPRARSHNNLEIYKETGCPHCTPPAESHRPQLHSTQTTLQPTQTTLQPNLKHEDDFYS